MSSKLRPQIKITVTALLIACLLTPLTAYTHERQYAFTTEYRTIPKNQFEIEQHVTSKVPNLHTSNKNSFKYETEVEWGITDQLTVAHYESLTTSNKAGTAKDSTKYSGFKFETKYRFGEKGKYWVDPLIYLEIAHDPREEHAPVVLEEKIVLSKDWKRLRIPAGTATHSGPNLPPIPILTCH